MRSATTILFTAGLVLFASYAQAENIGRIFPSAEEAAASLAEAARAADTAAILAILGPPARDLVEFGDEVAQKRAMEEFNRSYLERHRIAETNGRHTLIIGNNDWPFPIPLVKQRDGWFFDTASGREEILNRRIGENELNAAAVCRAYAYAQTEYAAADPAGTGVAQFAHKVMSSPGARDGLFWPVNDGEKPSPLGPLIAQATSEGYTDRTAQPDPYHGYLFRILTAQGSAARGGRKSYIEDGRMVHGFALIAYPAQWGSSGIMTFVVNQEGKVLEKDLGPDTSRIAGAITEYNPDRSWSPVSEDASL